MKNLAVSLLTLFLFAPHLALAQTPSTCARIAGLKVPASAIGLPTRGVVITSAQPIAAAGAGNGGYGRPGAHGRYCRVSGEIAPIDPAAQNIKFDIALPDSWNSKAVMLGGGGFDGVVSNVEGNFLNSPDAAPTPLARGYAVFGGDSGHQASPGSGGPAIGREDGVFFGNDEEYRNYIGDALKKTHDAAMVVIQAYYGRSPAKAYFLGGSKGGGEALTVAGRWPRDWDGIVALYPARNYTVSMLGTLAVSQALAAPGAYLDTAKRSVLYKAALAMCDGLDGAKDGLISDVRGCNRIFDPSTATLNGAPVRCLGGADTGDTCLSDAQIAALKKASAPVKFDFDIADGQRSFPGWNILTADLGGSSSSPFEPFVAQLTIGSSPATSPAGEGNSMAAKFSDNFMRFAVTRDPTFNQLTLNLTKPPANIAARLNELSKLDQVDADLTPYALRGGKLLIMHGTDDMLLSPRATELYVEHLHETLGVAKVDSFLRFYEVPGFGHSASTVFAAAWDQLSALEGWVETGVDPAHNQVVSDTMGVPGRTRPLCLYPTWPKYKGAGDINSAESFRCSKD